MVLFPVMKALICHGGTFHGGMLTSHDGWTKKRWSRKCEAKIPRRGPNDIRNFDPDHETHMFFRT